MKYAIPEERLYQLVSKYLKAMNLKSERLDGGLVDFAIKKMYPNGYSYIVIGWSEPNYLAMRWDFLKEISDAFSLDIDHVEEIITRWFKEKYELPVDRVESIIGFTFI